ncbi:nitroreductase family protein [Hydrogenophaga sp. RWCD_12]|uniref:nitroreductase family protein n=1 Tax=Hydrogenophaga sp. RWCD_12 TaxID=3391190 RepID=UPI003984641C
MAEALDVVMAYHERSKHRLDRYAAGPDTLDWDAQPDPFRRYAGAPLTALPLDTPAPTVAWCDLGSPDRIAAHPLGLRSIGLLFELSLALAAWKTQGPDRWAVRINPSSGNLHPTEGWLVCRGVSGLSDGVHHYAPHEHALEQRAAFAPEATPARAFVALSSIAWREAWKYGERAFRYCQLDAGHATGALRYAAALLGWRLRPVACDSAALAQLLGLDRDADFGPAEREEPDALFELLPAPANHAEHTAPWSWTAQATWQGQANRLDRHPMYRWLVIDDVTRATQRLNAAPIAASPSRITTPTYRRPNADAATLIRQRRSAQRFDPRARATLDQFWPLLQALHPDRLPFDAAPGPARVHVLVFAHRVDGLAPGAYLLPRSDTGLALLRQQLPEALDMTPVPDAPAGAPLLHLADNPALAGTLRTLNCHQALGSDAVMAFALLAEFQPLAEGVNYRDRLQEAGLIGQVLYLEAEAAGLRGTGIGCFFDDGLHQLLGLPEPAASAALQSVYHFTIGAPLGDDRIGTAAPYAHLAQLADPHRSLP